MDKDTVIMESDNAVDEDTSKSEANVTDEGDKSKSDVGEVKPTDTERNKHVVEIPKQVTMASFKMPMIIPSKIIKTKSAFMQEPKVIKKELVVNSVTDKTVLPKEEIPIVVKSVEKKPSTKPPKELPPFPYKEPKWGGKPNKNYSFEILKSGKILDTVDLSQENFYVFGRLESCNFVFEHPSVSRYHAILQFRAEGTEEHEAGFYVYDLESTHGTFLNKNQIRPRTYYRMKVGHILKVGGSSRLHILQGPEEDEEKESELTVTEIKALAIKKREEIMSKLESKESDVQSSESSKDSGVDWGFGEDAVEEPIGENPFTLAAEIAPNEDLYLNDPKKTLRGWFEREGYELEYKVEEKGVAHFSCRIELPIDAAYCQTYFAEATVKGKKKEAVLAAALEACRILDRNGLLRQSQHEGRKRKKKNWEEEDFYDSDEDTFLDRTGTIEKKREMRKKMVSNETETYDSLREKFSNVEKEMDEINELLEQSAKKTPIKNPDDQTEDSLEAYMAAITKSEELDKTKKSRLRLQLGILQREKNRLEKLINLARPTSLPPLTLVKDLKSKIQPMVGSMKGFKAKTSLNKIKAKVVTPVKVIKTETEEFEEEVEDDDVNEKQRKKEKETSAKIETQDEIPLEDDTSKSDIIELIEENNMKVPDDEEESIMEDDEMETDERDQIKVIGPIIPEDVEISDVTENLNESKPNPLNQKKNVERIERRKRAKKGAAGYNSSDPDYAMWLPPNNQTGDGKTHLNDKYGY